MKIEKENENKEQKRKGISFFKCKENMQEEKENTTTFDGIASHIDSAIGDRY